MVGPVRRGRGRRLRVERRVVPVTADEDRRAQVFERELWRIAVEHLTWGEQHAWAVLAGARVASNNWRRAKAMLHFDRTGELRRASCSPACSRNRNSQLRIRALQEVGSLRDPEAFDEAVEIVGAWARDERREGVKVLLQALAERQIGRRDQAARWIWHLAEYTREVHEEYAVPRWPETKRLLGLLVNSSGGAHARNARRLVQAARSRTAACRPRCWPPRWPTRPRPSRCSTARACAWPASRPPWPASCCATSQGQAPPRRPAPAQEGREARPRAGAHRDARSGAEEQSAESRRAADKTLEDAATPPKATPGRRPETSRPTRVRRRQPGERAAANATLRVAWRAGGPRRRPVRPGPRRSPPAARPCRRCPRPCPRRRPSSPCCPRSASRARHAASTSAGGRPSQRSRPASSRPSTASRSSVRPGRAQRCGRVSQLGRELRRRDVETDAQHRPALLRPALDQDARQLAPLDPDVVGPLDRAAAAARASQTATAAASGSTSLELAQHERHQQRRCPAAPSSAALAPAAGGLLVRRDQRAVRRARAASSCARSLVESVIRWWTRGRPIISAAAAPRRPAAAPASRRRPAVDRKGQRPVGVLVDDQLARPHVGEGLA